MLESFIDKSLQYFPVRLRFKDQMLYQWRGILRQRQTVSANTAVFTEVVSESAAPAHSLTLQLGQAQLLFQHLPEAAWLAQLIAAHD